MQAVTGLHKAGVLHRDIKPDNLLLVGDDLLLNDFDVSCLTDSSDATLQLRVGTEAFWSPVWRAEQRYREVDDLASLLLSFAAMLHAPQKDHPIKRILFVAQIPDAPQTLIDTAKHIERMYEQAA